MISPESVTDRFLRYVKIDTQSDPESSTVPSTAKQKNLGKVLVEELKAIGIKDAELNEHGYIYATIPGTTTKKVPVLCFCSHMDTSPDCSGANVNPIIHKNYQGGNIVLPNDKTQVLTPAAHPDLKNQKGNDIVTTDGTTLLGADNKAGLAEIMAAAEYLMKHPEVKHGVIRILFTPDEEIGRGVDKVDMKKLGAEFGYTIDGESLGHIEAENFSADAMSIIINGVSAHPGFAKGQMESAIKIAGAIIEKLPKNVSPEGTEDMEGFVHPTSVSGGIEQTTIKFIIRDFVTEGLKKKKDMLKEITEKVLKDYPNSTAEFKIVEQYRNMKVVIDKHPQIIKYAEEAMKRSGIKSHLQSIRGGTDGSRLSFMGMPCPNIFAGEHAFHGKQEWVSVQDMQKAAEVIVNICNVWEENSPS
ncbi:MAG TPA: peptidase T [Bacteroidia bacterium]|jgi:tripeptide aminopeptidase|nr:peptidase T [Bacteroidia bacterium]